MALPSVTISGAVSSCTCSSSAATQSEKRTGRVIVPPCLTIGEPLAPSDTSSSMTRTPILSACERASTDALEVSWFPLKYVLCDAEIK